MFFLKKLCYSLFGEVEIVLAYFGKRKKQQDENENKILAV